MTKLKRKPPKPRPRRIIMREMKSWNLGTYLQWIPVITVAVGGIVWFTHLQDAVEQLKKDIPASSLSSQLTHIEDDVAVHANAIAELKANVAANYAEMKSNDQDIWRHISNSKQDSKP